jgi:O-glycosyl hydrolase
MCSGKSTPSGVGGTPGAGGGVGGSGGSGGKVGTGTGGTTIPAGSGGLPAVGGKNATGGKPAGGSTGTRDAGLSTIDAAGGIQGKGGSADAASPADGKVAGAGGANGGNTGERPKVAASPGTTLVKVNVKTKYQTFEGWGTSLCWWAAQIGGWSTAKKNEFLDLIVNPTTGLGYNIFRYNIGGGDAPSHDHMGAGREMPGFQSSDGKWDWNADAKQTSVLTRLVETGKDVIVEAFSNSPPYWMTKSGCASGNSDGSNNLKDDSYDAFAAYLVGVAKHYRDSLGITFRTLEPMNEPNADWWKAEGGQEGCHFGASNQQQIIKAVGAKLTSEGLADTHVSASDENSMDDAYSIMSGYDTTTLGHMSQINVHSYSGSKRSQMRTLATSKGKRLWQSETGPLNTDLATNTDAAIFMAGRIIQDLRELRPEAWIEWQVVDPANSWTSFTVNDTKETWTPLKRFHMQAGFSRYIRPGATFVDVDNSDMVAALSADGAVLTLVVRNGDSKASKGFTFDLTSLPSLGSSIQAWRTSANEDLAAQTAVTVDNWSFVATVPAYSVTTFVVPLGSP